MAVKKHLTHLEWVRLAVSRDKRDYRVALKGYHATDKELAATNAHRLHVAPNDEAVMPGLWDKDGVAIEATYPNYQRVIPQAEPRFTVADRDELIAVCEGAIAYAKSKRLDAPLVFATLDGRTSGFNAGYLRDALVGVGDGYRLVVAWAAHLEPIKLFDPMRLAVIMPVRLADVEIDARWSVTDLLLQPIEAQIPAEVA